MKDNIDNYLSGERLYGDDFGPAEIAQWYAAEQEAYANLGSKNSKNYVYTYHALNQKYGYRFLPDGSLGKVLGLGAAWGHEFLPLTHRIDELHIVEPSLHLRSAKVGALTPVYTSPVALGTISYPDAHFNLITCFGTLHHIPNASFVLSELCRVTKPGGMILIREPVISMGDWRRRRAGLTTNERGIPLAFFRAIISDLHLTVVNEALHFTMTAFLQRNWSRLFNKPIYTYQSYLKADGILSRLFAWNLQYHATRRLKRIAPHSVFYVLKKQQT